MWVTSVAVTAMWWYQRLMSIFGAVAMLAAIMNGDAMYMLTVIADLKVVRWHIPAGADAEEGAKSAQRILQKKK